MAIQLLAVLTVGPMVNGAVIVISVKIKILMGMALKSNVHQVTVGGRIIGTTLFCTSARNSGAKQCYRNK